jgi:hypothetical protein
VCPEAGKKEIFESSFPALSLSLTPRLVPSLTPPILACPATTLKEEESHALQQGQLCKVAPRHPALHHDETGQGDPFPRLPINTGGNEREKKKEKEGWTFENREGRILGGQTSVFKRWKTEIDGEGGTFWDDKKEIELGRERKIGRKREKTWEVRRKNREEKQGKRKEREQERRKN